MGLVSVICWPRLPQLDVFRMQKRKRRARQKARPGPLRKLRHGLENVYAKRIAYAGIIRIPREIATLPVTFFAVFARMLSPRRYAAGGGSQLSGCPATKVVNALYGCASGTPLIMMP